MSTKSRLAAVGFLITAFVLGAIVGGVGYSLADRGPGGIRHSHGRDGFIARLTDQLQLSVEQQDSIRTILDRNRPVMDSMWDEVRPRFDSARTALRNQIRAQLDQGQQQRYQEMLERRERESRERRPR